MVPLSAPNNRSLLSGTTVTEVSIPLKASDLSLVELKDACPSMEVWTPILLAVVPVISSELYTAKQCTGSAGPLKVMKNFLMRYV